MADDSRRLTRACPAHAGAWVLCLALALRVGWVMVAWSGSGPRLAFDDERLHWSIARNLALRGELVTDDGQFAARMPLYPLFLACFAGAGDAGVLAARITQSLCGALGALLVYALARRELGPRPGLIAGLLAACDPFTVFACNLLLTEALYTPVSVALAMTGLRLATGGGRASLAGAALSGTACVMIRPASLGWVVIVWLAALAGGETHARRLARGAVLATSLAAALLPWGLRNRAVIGEFAWLSTNGGVTLYDGQGPQADGSSNQSFMTAMPDVAALPEAQRDRALRRLAVAEMRRDPLRVLCLGWAKLARMWNVLPNYSELRGGWIGWISAVWMLAVMAGAIAGSILAGRDRIRPLAWITLAYFTLVHCVYVGSVRYRVPLHPFIELLAARAFIRKPPNSAADAVSERG